MLAIQREHCSFVTEEGVETPKLFKVNGGSRVMVRVCVPPEATKSGKRTGRGFTRFVAASSAVEVFRRKMNEFDSHPKSFLFGTQSGSRVASFRKSATETFEMVNLDFGRGEVSTRNVPPLGRRHWSGTHRLVRVISGNPNDRNARLIDQGAR